MNKAKTAATQQQQTDGALALHAVRDDEPAAAVPKTKPALRLIKASSIPITLVDWVWEYGGSGRISRAALHPVRRPPRSWKVHVCPLVRRQLVSGDSGGVLGGQPRQRALHRH